MTEPLPAFIRNTFQWDRMSEVNWSLVRDNVLAARRVLAAPEKFPRANFDHLEKMDLEGTCFLLRAPIQFIV
jgi:hypothetical protein